MTIHEQCQWLFTFGEQHHYPAIAFFSLSGTLYAMGYGGDKDIWRMQAAAGKDEYIHAAYEYLVQQQESENYS